MYSEDTVLRLIQRIYDAATEASGWQTFLTELSAALGASGAGLLQHEVRPNALVRGSILASSTLAPEGVQLYGERYAPLDPWGNALARQGRLDGDFLFTSESLVPESQLRRTEFYNDFSRHYDIAGNVGFGVSTEPGLATTVTVVRGHRSPPFGTEALRLMAALQPHIRRAVLVHQRLSGAELSRLQSATVLDLLPHGVLLLGPRGRVISVNRTAEEMLCARDGLVGDGGELIAATPDATAALHAALAAAVNLEGARIGDTIGIALPRPSGRRPLSAVIAPLPVRRRMGVDDGARLLLIVTDPERTRTVSPATIARVLDLTPAEARLAHALATGASLDEAAARLGVRLETVRSRLKVIFQKTDTHRQADLVRLVLSLPDLVPRP